MKWALVAAFMLAASPASATFITGNKALEECDDTRPAFDFGYCQGLVTGLYDGAAYFSSVRHCAPDNMILRQVMDIYIAHLRRNPQERHLPAAVIMNRAMTVAFPCR